MSDRLKTRNLENFWKAFQDLTDSAKAPAVLKMPESSGPLFSFNDAFEIMNSIFENGDVCVNIDGQLKNNPVLLMPPEKASKYNDFVNDLACANSCENITFTRDYCLKYSQSLADKIQDFTNPYTQKYGVPFDGINAVFIGGKYKSTWIGLHNDFCDTMLIPAVGSKRMNLWPPFYFKEKALIEEPSLNGICYGHIDITPYKEDAITIDVRPGETLFIPSYWWHYNDLDEPETTMTLSVGFFKNVDIKQSISKAFTTSLAMISKDYVYSNHRPIPGGHLSSSLNEIELDKEIEDIFERAKFLFRLEVLRNHSSGGVIAGTKMAEEVPVLMSSQIIGRASCPTYLVKDMQPNLLVAGGEILAVKSSMKLHKFVEMINSGQPFKLGDIPTKQISSKALLCEYTTWLAIRRAITIRAH